MELRLTQIVANELEDLLEVIVGNHATLLRKDLEDSIKIERLLLHMHRDLAQEVLIILDLEGSALFESGLLFGRGGS